MTIDDLLRQVRGVDEGRTLRKDVANLNRLAQHINKYGAWGNDRQRALAQEIALKTEQLNNLVQRT